MKYRKLFLLIGSLLFFQQKHLAQTKIELGLKAGLNYSNLALGAEGRSLYVEKHKPMTGFHLGGFALFKFSKFALQPEIIYSRQGQLFSYYNTGYYSTVLNYINLPVMVRFSLFKSLKAQLGPQVGFLIGGSSSVYITQTRNVTDQSLTDLLNPLELSAAFGLCWNLPLGLSASVRYTHGLTDISKYSGGMLPNGIVPPSGTVPIGTVNAKNQVFQLSIGYAFLREAR